MYPSPDGNLVHKADSYQKVADFISIAKEALVPGKKYNDPFAEFYMLLREYQAGNKNYQKMPYMISKGTQAGESEFVGEDS